MMLGVMFADDVAKDKGNFTSLREPTTLKSVPFHLHRSTGQADSGELLQGAEEVMVVVVVFDVKVAGIVVVVAVLNVVT